MAGAAISRIAFDELRELFRRSTGITLGPDKQQTVQTRLLPRLEALELDSFEAYCRFLRKQDDGSERAAFVDLLTTHETYFFREPRHFEFLKECLGTRFRGRPLRVWSAACSTGEEAYSLAMTLLTHRPTGEWELFGTDVSRPVIEQAKLGVYSMKRIDCIPPGYLQRFCLRGTGKYAGRMRVGAEVRERVQFVEHNLLSDMAVLGTFDVVFVRNVLIYFDLGRRREVLLRMLSRLRPSGLLFIGHAESLQGLELPLQRVRDAVFEVKKP